MVEVDYTGAAVPVAIPKTIAASWVLASVQETRPVDSGGERTTSTEM